MLAYGGVCCIICIRANQTLMETDMHNPTSPHDDDSPPETTWSAAELRNMNNNMLAALVAAHGVRP